MISSGPTVRHMRTMLVDPERVQGALGDEFTITEPWEIGLREDTERFTNDQLMARLLAYKAIAGTIVTLSLVGLCAAQSHSRAAPPTDPSAPPVPSAPR